jgi:uncharacterized protein YcfJ
MKASTIFGTLAVATTTAMVLSIASSMANAQTFNVVGSVVSSNPKYVTQTRNVPQQICNEIQVPIYGQGHNSNNNGIFGGIGGALQGDTNALIGTIIGGAIGNKVGKGGGRDGATALGAIIGGNIGNRQNQQQGNGIVGYRQQQQCHTQYHTESTQVLRGYIVTFNYNGMQGSTVRQNAYQPGDKIQLRLSLSAQ